MVDSSDQAMFLTRRLRTRLSGCILRIERLNDSESRFVPMTLLSRDSLMM